MNPLPLQFRDDVSNEDIKAVAEIVVSTGFFYEHEIEVAVELIETRLLKGEESGYRFLFAMQGDRTIGYSCFGTIPCTMGSYDLYWIVVHNDFRALGIGRKLLAETETRITGEKGRAVYAETSSQTKYAPTRNFYEKNGYAAEAVLKDFYAPGDDKFIYKKRLNAT